MAYERTLKESFRALVDHQLPSLAYNIAYHCLRQVHFDAGPNRRGANWFAGAGGGPLAWGIDYGGGFRKTTIERDGATIFAYRPAHQIRIGQGSGEGHKDAPVIEFHDFTLDDIDSYEVMPAVLTPQGSPTSQTYTIENDRPKAYADEFEVEKTKETQQENTWSTQLSIEMEAALKLSAGISVNAELTSRIQKRIENREDIRWQQNVTHRQLLRGKFPVGPYAVLEATLVDQLTNLKQPVHVRGPLDCCVRIVMCDDYAVAEWDSLGAMLDTFRGYGGPGKIGEVFGKAGAGIPEQTIADKLEAYRPMVRLVFNPHVSRTLSSKKSLIEKPYPGREDPPDGDGLYEKYKAQPTPSDPYGGGGYDPDPTDVTDDDQGAGDDYDPDPTDVTDDDMTAGDDYETDPTDPDS